MKRKINVALVGLGFGGAFVPIYRAHSNVGEVSLYDPCKDTAKIFAQRYGITKIFDSYEQILSDDTVDAIHLISPIPCHEIQTVQALSAGKHCACTVPMGVTLEGLTDIIRTVRASKKKYMMMETAVYTTHFFHAKEMLVNGQFGDVQFLRGAHYQDMEHWPDYWMGLPPMHYGTHAIAPLVMLSGSKIVNTHCLGSGVMRRELHQRYGNPYPVECALFTFENGIKAEATRSLFSTARDYSESFTVYGSKSSFEWQQIESENNPVIFTLGDSVPDGSGGFYRGRPITNKRIIPQNYDHLLPEAIRKYTVRGKYFDETNPQLTFEEGGGHGGSHPHLVHEFLQSIIEDRRPWIDEIIAANITAAGICAHASAMQGGKEVAIPDFENIV